MVTRTLIGSYPTLGGGAPRIRISKPLKDVLSAGLNVEDLAFDSSWNDAAVVYRTGIVNVVAPKPVYVNFGETLPTAPFCIVFRVLSSGEFWMGSTDDTGPNSFNWHAECTTSYLRFHGYHSLANDYIGGYVILRGPL
ncbi:hypothetical protein [Phyllobacterium endophyticum]|uniref:Uncharacterized protein n=1 Tax=Phyllobacterium endophyticum TaxID=1149773 RepID=A0A2P7AUR2_9HYPH|nr:hypothetical protein [Phyllobacterium endophyticum]MBB3234448.1 hypothetical protein [Phyllobacterium endophyticum]PSH57956.1 hypothetical protein CU100_09760 [Phyllobacterium endophyticum]TYR44164.1 hypothetical protein FY050_03110 [Phyllobacterium endophyticum]